MEAEKEKQDFIRNIVREDLSLGKNNGNIHTRFPPEPNGFLHIGHAKAICIDFGIAEEFGGKCNLRLDDTNPCKEDPIYVQAIEDDVRWLGFDWGPKLFHASDFFDQMFDCAVFLIRKGLAYVCDLNSEELRRTRGTLTEAGIESPFRSRSVDENLRLFNEMREGKYPEGSKTLRAKIDMANPNIIMRDPVMYRILFEAHHRTGDKWKIYPTYDWAHGLEDYFEGITHSICTLEFEIHRPLYDWFLENLELAQRPRQIEFARLNLAFTVMSKRKLLELVQGSYVKGWDDPRLPTIAGMRRRGYSPAAIRNFCDLIGVTKFNSLTDFALLEHCLREDLNKKAPRAMAVLNPIKLVFSNLPDGHVEWLDAINNPEDPSAGTRKVPFSKELYIDADDFREVPPPKYYRLSPGQEVRLRYAYVIKCLEIVKDPVTGEIKEIICSVDSDSKGGNTKDGRKIKGTIHWVSAPLSHCAELRLYEPLFKTEIPDDVPPGGDFKDNLNPDSLKIVKAFLEPSLAKQSPGTIFQFERVGYFCADKDSTPAMPVFNRAATLKDSWSKIENKQKTK